MSFFRRNKALAIALGLGLGAAGTIPLWESGTTIATPPDVASRTAAACASVASARAAYDRDQRLCSRLDTAPARADCGDAVNAKWAETYDARHLDEILCQYGRK